MCRTRADGTAPAKVIDSKKWKTIFTSILQPSAIWCHFNSHSMAGGRGARYKFDWHKNAKHAICSKMCHKNVYFIHYFRYYCDSLTHSHMRQRASGAKIGESFSTSCSRFMSSYIVYWARVSVADTTYECDCDVTLLKLVVSAFPQPLRRRRPHSGSDAHPSMSRSRCTEILTLTLVRCSKYDSARLAWRHGKWYAQITERAGVRLPAATRPWLRTIVKNKNQCHKYPIQFFSSARTQLPDFILLQLQNMDWNLSVAPSFEWRRTYALLLLHINVNFTWIFFFSRLHEFMTKKSHLSHVLAPPHLTFSLQINSHWSAAVEYLIRGLNDAEHTRTHT